MTTISAALVKELRERSGAPMMDCKRALEGANGDIDAAMDAMRMAGQAKADKKAGRIAAEGLITVASNPTGTLVALVETNCETDFVARDVNFVSFAKELADLALANKTADRDALLQTAMGEGTVDTTRATLVGKLGENINVRRVELITAEDCVVGTYIHGGRIGVAVQLRGGDIALAKDLAMHVAANQPKVVSPDQVPQELLDKEREIYTAQVQESGKPADIMTKMIEGRMKKFLDEVSLLGQPFVKDPSINVATLLKNAKADVVTFYRFEVGEGIEKEKVDFAKEVMDQVKGISA
jgi:elongation factor Ts